MKIPLYLAMTVAEFSKCKDFPSHIAWMACHFSPYGAGLSNLPPQLPSGALLILNDQTPVQGHDPKKVRQALADTVSSLGCSAVLLDMQRQDCPQTKAIIQEVLSLPCPVCVSDIYAKDLDCPVFLPPVPLICAPDAYFAPWQGREIWLDMAIDSIELSITEAGCHHNHSKITGPFPYQEECLCCHYRSEFHNDCIHFYLHRTKEDLYNLLARSAAYGVTAGVGLWQELK